MDASRSGTWSRDRPLRIAIADDSEFWVAGMEKMLDSSDVQVAFVARSSSELLTRLDQEMPDLVTMDMQMPPDGDEAGIAATREIRRRGWEVPVLILSAYIYTSPALTLLMESPQGVGYLSKEGATNRTRLLEAFSRLLAGGLVVEQDLVQKMMNRPRASRRLEGLTPRQRDVLRLMAQGLSDKAIAAELDLVPRTVQGHVSDVMRALNLDHRDDESHRRVGAVLMYLDAEDALPSRR